MKAIQIQAPRTATVIDLPVPEPAEDEVLFKLKGCVTCPHWDITLYTGVDIFERPGYPRYPILPGRPGHEAAGEVAAVGAAVEDLREGDRVASLVTPGEDKFGYYCEYLNRRHDTVVRVPPDVSYDSAASMEMARYVSAYVRALGDIRDKRVGVIGQGPAGLIATQLCLALGAGEVVAVDIVPARLEMAKRLGATEILDGKDDGSLGRLENRPLECSIDCSGAGSGLQIALDNTKGPVSIFGVVHGEARYSTRHWNSGVYIAKRNPITEKDTRMVLDLWSRGTLDTEILVSSRLPFERYAEGIESLMQKRAVKVLYHP
jgi:threonine dehydrogenase-like Zn-dependent dehydrogenase